jgi:hypothetical protein
MNNQPLREAGRFAIEVYSEARLIGSGFKFEEGNFVVVYADNDQPSHSRWMVPGTRWASAPLR